MHVPGGKLEIHGNGSGLCAVYPNDVTFAARDVSSRGQASKIDKGVLFTGSVFRPEEYECSIRVRQCFESPTHDTAVRAE